MEYHPQTRFERNSDWVTALGAISFRRHDLHDLQRGSFGVDWALLLRRSFGIETHEALKQRLNETLARLSDPVLTAWAAGTAVFLTRLGVHTDLLLEKDVQGRLHLAAGVVRRRYSSWAEFGHHYLCGRALAEDAFDVLDERSYHQLLSEPSSAWKRLPWELYPSEEPPPWLRLRLAFLCDECGRFVNVYHVGERHTCPECLAPLQLPLERWQHTKRKLRELAERGPYGRVSTVNFNQEEVSSLVGERCAPECRRGCGPLTLDPASLSAEQTTCAVCKLSTRVRRADAYVAEALGKFHAVVGERPELATAYHAHSGIVMAVSCDNCGAPLPIESVERQPTCRFCHARTTIPEAAWRRLVPLQRAPWIYVELAS